MAVFHGIPFFEGLDSALAETHGRRCARRRFAEQELVVDYEDDTTDVYFIVAGGVRVLIRSASGKEMIFGEFGPGRFFGEMAAIDGTRRSANVTALTTTELCVVPAADFRDIVFSQPVICDRLLRVLTGRVRDLNTRLFERSALDLRHRLYSELLRLAAPRKGAAGQSIVSPPPLQHDLAARIGCRREQVSRELGAMIDAGLAEKIRGGLVLTQPEALAARVHAALDEAD